jgi:hypothetical protein
MDPKRNPQISRVMENYNQYQTKMPGSFGMPSRSNTKKSPASPPKTLRIGRRDSVIKLDDIDIDAIRKYPDLLETTKYLQGQLFNNYELCVLFFDRIMKENDMFAKAHVLILPVWWNNVCLTLYYSKMAVPKYVIDRDVFGKYEIKETKTSLFTEGDMLQFLLEEQPNTMSFSHPMSDHLMKDKIKEDDYKMVVDHVIPVFYDLSIKNEVI